METIKNIIKKSPLLVLLYLNILSRIKKGFLQIKYRSFKKEPTMANLASNSKYFSKIYNLNQAHYFETMTNYAQDENFRNQAGVQKKYLPLYHLAALEFLEKNVSKKAEILDICCGMGQFFIFLKESGFSQFTGIEDSIFQPGIISAARSFLNYYHTKAHLENFNVSYPGNYKKFRQESFDVVMHFGVGTYYFFTMVSRILRSGGYFILETAEEDAGVWRDKFKVIKIYKAWGREASDGHAFNTIIFQKIL